MGRPFRILRCKLVVPAERVGLHLNCRLVTRDALPLSSGHLPRIGEAFIGIERFTGCVSAFGFKASGGYGSITKDHDFHVGVIDARELGRLGFSDRLGLICDLTFI